MIGRVMEIFIETKSRVKVGKKMGEEFWTARGVRQGYLLSSIFFNLI